MKDPYRITNRETSLILPKMTAVEGVSLNHSALITTDVKRLAEFYKEMFGFEEVKAPKFQSEIIWLKLSSSFLLHLIERKNPKSNGAVLDPNNTPIGPHLCFSVPNFDSFAQTLQEKGILYKEITISETMTRHAFFYDPEGNGLEACSNIPSIDMFV